ncbi:MAG: hypothetical protein IT444_13600 [Phycisphaeraceae bacterium]|nr:hypothetical protein [Phycisphaeraceae bacterium]
MRKLLPVLGLTLLSSPMVVSSLHAEEPSPAIPAVKLDESAVKSAVDTALEAAGEKAEAAVADKKSPVVEKTNDAGPVLEGATIQWRSLMRMGQIDLATNNVNYTLSISGNVNLPANSQVVAMGNPLVLLEANDQNGKSLRESREDIIQAFGDNVTPRIINYQFIQISGGAVQSSTGIQLDRISATPTKISSLKGYVPLVTVVKTEAKTLKAEAGETAELSKDITLKVEQFQQAQTSASVIVKLSKPALDPQQPWQSAMSTPPVMTNLELVDESGQVLAKAENLFHNPHSFEQNTVTVTMQGQFQGFTGTVSGVRVTVATELALKQVPFALKDVPLP